MTDKIRLNLRDDIWSDRDVYDAVRNYDYVIGSYNDSMYSEEWEERFPDDVKELPSIDDYPSIRDMDDENLAEMDTKDLPPKLRDEFEDFIESKEQEIVDADEEVQNAVAKSKFRNDISDTARDGLDYLKYKDLNSGELMEELENK